MAVGMNELNVCIDWVDMFLYGNVCFTKGLILKYNLISFPFLQVAFSLPLDHVCVYVCPCM
jgi:hypothetical protein